MKATAARWGAIGVVGLLVAAAGASAAAPREALHPPEARDRPLPRTTPPLMGPDLAVRDRAEPERTEYGALTAARARLRLGTSSPAAEVDRWAVSLATQSRTSAAALNRFGRYRPLIEAALVAEGLPRDLAFLPWVESEWRNEATSRAGAAGIWQLMPPTARAYGLEVSAFVDERRDPVRATRAAVRHLAELHRQTADWHLTLAAYNAGLGRVERARGGGFWRRRSALPAETRVYVPRVLAAARVGRDPAAWGLEIRTATPLRFREVWTAGGTMLDSVADRTGASRAAVRELNPHLIRAETPPGRSWPVRVPHNPEPNQPR